MSSPWPGRTPVSRTELNPVSFLYRSVAIHPDRVAVVHLDRRYSYADLGERVNRLASALRAHGLAPHDRVAALCPNVPALLELHHGVPAAGGVLVAINTRLSSPEIRHIIEHSGARMLFVDAELESLIAEPPGGVEVIRVDDDGQSTDPYEQLLAEGSPNGVPSTLLDEEEPMAIDYTSGTTGQPKGVVYTFRGAYLNALGEVIEADLGHHPVYLWTLPMFHCNGWCFPWAVTAASGTHVCLRQVDPKLSWRLFKDEGVTHYNASPTVQIALVNHPDAARLERQVTSLVAGAHRLRRRCWPAWRSSTSGRCMSTGSPRPTARKRCPCGTRVGTNSRQRNAPACRPARDSSTRPPMRSALSMSRCKTCRATPPRWARS